MNVPRTYRGRFALIAWPIACSALLSVAADVVAAPVVMSQEENTSARASAISPDGVWQEVVGPKALSPGFASPKLRAFRMLRADAGALSTQLLRAPLGAKGRPVESSVTIMLPMPDGTFSRFAIERVELLAPDVQAQFPDIHTFRAHGIDDPGANARLELSPFGFRAYVMRSGGDAVIDPAGEGEYYRSFWKSDAEREAFACDVHEAPDASSADLRWLGARLQKSRSNGANIRTYRFAAALTGEYTQFFGASCAPGSPANCPSNAAAAALTTTMNRVTGLLERDADVSLTITTTRIFTDPATDPYATGGTVNGALLGENQTALDANPGSAAYDIGHVFTAGGGGGLVQGRTCRAADKARGGTGRNNPVGDPYDVDYVAHEVGHQLDASHTWTSNQGFCSPGQFVATSGYEPGSGSTIMAYAGICGGDDLQPNSDAYYHVRSIDQITDFRNNAGTGGSCGALTNTGNGPPAANAGGDFTIPRDTPFVLTATASDPDGDALTFDWEQYDTGAQIAGIPPATQATGPLFRSFQPTASASRTFPRIQAVLGTATSPWEVLPNVDRTMNFRVTARDNRANGGGTDFDQMTVTVSGAPFAITAPSGSSSLQCAASGTIDWQVGGGSVAPTVRADYSSNDGTTFTTLIASTANDGSEGFTIPRPPTANGRIRLSAIGNIFFDISPRFAIVDTIAPTVTAPPARGAECTSPSGTPVALGAASTTDTCDLTPSLGNNAPALFPLGTTAVTWTSTDASGNSGTATQLVTIVDTTPPVVTPPPDVTAECTGPSGTPVNIGIATATDICDASLVLGNNAPSLFGLGSTVVQWSARDDSNNVGTANQTVKVVDTTPPALSVSLSPDTLWPPNHKMVRIAATIKVTDICDPNPQVRLLSATSSEPDNGLGDGDTTGDIQGAATGTDDRDFSVRAERDGRGDGRVYTITYEARDASGNTTVKTATVLVPKSQR